MRSRISILLPGCLVLSLAVFLCGAVAPTDFGQEATLLRYLEQGDYTSSSCIVNIVDGHSDEYRCREVSVTADFTNFSGAKTLLELEWGEWVESEMLGFQIAADVAGDYRVLVVSGDGDILLSASSFQWQAASRPVEIPPGRVKVVLVGEGATGALRLELYPPTVSLFPGKLSPSWKAAYWGGFFVSEILWVVCR